MKGLIINSTYEKQESSGKNNPALILNGEDTFYVKENLTGSNEYVFTLDIIKLFDTLVLTDNMKILSVKQRNLLTQYLNEHTSDKLTQLDVYLAGYKG